MIFEGAGLSLTELRAMDLAEFAEAYEARAMYVRDTAPKSMPRIRLPKH